MSYFQEPYTFCKNKIKVNLANYAIKSDLKNAAGANISKFVKELDLASLKSEINDLDIDKLKTVSVYL